LFLLETF